ncbi:hypothetical protein AB1Y20_022208 [Prymnesium parvum]
MSPLASAPSCPAFLSSPLATAQPLLRVRLLRSLLDQPASLPSLRPTSSFVHARPTSASRLPPPAAASRSFSSSDQPVQSEEARPHVPAAPEIHPTAVVDPAATLGRGVRIGPFSVVGPHASLGEDVCLHSHVVIAGHTSIGEGTTVYSHATVGAAPQDRKHAATHRSELRIGRHCRLFEYAHVSGGTQGGGGVTSIGDECLVMSHTHVGHDCSLGARVVLASGSALAGHVVVGDAATISGHSCVHQRVAIGRGAFLAGASVLVDDLIPFGLAIGNRAQLHSLNLRGIRRSAVSATEQRAMLRAFRFLFQLPPDHFYKPLQLPNLSSLQERAKQLHMPQHPHVMAMVDFILGSRPHTSNRALCQPRLSSSPSHSS